MAILISVSLIVSIFVLFFSYIACIFECNALCLWPSWMGWSGLMIGTFALCGKTIQITLKEVVPVILDRLSSFNTTPKSTTRTIKNGNQKWIVRHFANIGILIISSTIAVFGLSEGLRLPQVKEVEIKIKALHPDLEGFSIVQISDLHISPSLRQNWVQQIVDQINDLSPDIIAFTGDIADGIFSEINGDVTQLADLKASYGKYFVTGNHDYEDMAGDDVWITEIKKLGFIVLQNEHRLITYGHGSILLGGVADYSAPSRGNHESSPAEAMGKNTKADIKILLAHQPRSLYEAAQVGFDLQLSGHTHGGMISPVRWLKSLAQPFQSGLYLYKNIQIYVSNGTGYWGIPFRLGTPSEISLLKLTSG